MRIGARCVAADWRNGRAGAAAAAAAAAAAMSAPDNAAAASSPSPSATTPALLVSPDDDEVSPPVPLGVMSPPMLGRPLSPPTKYAATPPPVRSTVAAGNGTASAGHSAFGFFARRRSIAEQHARLTAQRSESAIAVPDVCVTDSPSCERLTVTGRIHSWGETVPSVRALLRKRADPEG